MCDCVDEGVCEIVVMYSFQYLCVIVVSIQEVSPSLSFEHDVRTMQEAGAERERERESQIVRIPRPTRTRQMMTVSNNQMVSLRHK